MRASEVVVRVLRSWSSSVPSGEPVGWEAYAVLGPLRSDTGRPYDRPASALGQALTGMATRVCDHDVPELGKALSWNLWGRSPLAPPIERTHAEQVWEAWRYLDACCRVCERINAHPERAIVIALLADAYAAKSHGKHDPRLYVEAFEKAALLSDAAVSSPVSRVRRDAVDAPTTLSPQTAALAEQRLAELRRIANSEAS